MPPSYNVSMISSLPGLSGASPAAAALATPAAPQSASGAPDPATGLQLPEAFAALLAPAARPQTTNPLPQATGSPQMADPAVAAATAPAHSVDPTPRPDPATRIDDQSTDKGPMPVPARSKPQMHAATVPEADGPAEQSDIHADATRIDNAIPLSPPPTGPMPVATAPDAAQQPVPGGRPAATGRRHPADAGATAAPAPERRSEATVLPDAAPPVPAMEEPAGDQSSSARQRNGTADLPTPLAGRAEPTPQTQIHTAAPAPTFDEPVSAEPVSRAAPSAPAQARPEADVAVAMRSLDGLKELDVRLVQSDLGRVDVRLSFPERGRLEAVVASDNPATLDLLRRDGAELARALSAAAPSSEGATLSFQSRTSDEQSPRRGPARTRNGTVAPIEDAPAEWRPTAISGRIERIA
jgi:hypothetical protein